MKIEIRSDKVVITGYVNAVGRDSRIITSSTGEKFVEQVEPGVFGAALKRARNVDLLINHKPDMHLGSTTFGNIVLTEDSIGLRAYAEITDPAAIEKARRGEFIGWSYGMYVNRDEMEQRADDIPRRHLKDIDLFEVSLIDRTMQPCYAGTSVECRAEDESIVSETRLFEDEIETVNAVVPDLSDYERRAAALAIAPYERRAALLAVVPYE